MVKWYEEDKLNMKLAWLSDTHLDQVSSIDITRLCRGIAKEGADAIVITGNVSSGHQLVESLGYLETNAFMPVYYVLGQKDYSHTTIDKMRAVATAIETEEGYDPIVYVSTRGPVELTDTLTLVGLDGWGDLREGRKKNTRFLLRDHIAIKDFRKMDNDSIMGLLQNLADSDVRKARETLLEVLESGKDVLLLSSVIPFSELLEKDGDMPNDDMLAYYVCRVLGDTLLELADEYPDRKIRVLCGSMQTDSTHSPRENLTCETNSRDEDRLCVQKFLEVS